MAPTTVNNENKLAPIQKVVQPIKQSSFQTLLDNLESEFSRKDLKVDVDEIWRVLEDYKSSPSDWSRYAYYDMRKYKRNLVTESPNYNVMILCWAPGATSSIHDHAGAHCFMKVLDGELVESRFAWPDESQLKGRKSQEMYRVSDTKMTKNNIFYINDKVGLHLVKNPSLTKTAASLHVYIPPYKKCRTFDQTTGRARDCKLTFYSKCGRLVKDEEGFV